MAVKDKCKDAMCNTAEIQTPFFLVKESILRENVKGFATALDSIWKNSVIAYSVKTNSLPWVLRWMNKNGVYAEVVSDAEYELACMCGFPENEIVFNGPIKTVPYIKRAFDNGAIANIDSKREVDYIEEARPAINGNLGVRVNIDPGIFDEKDIGYEADGFRFGFSDSTGELGCVFDKLEAVYGHRNFGLHVHVNSVTRSLGVYNSLAAYTAEIIKKYKIDPPFIDIGGGFFGGVPGKPTPNQYVEIILEQLQATVDVNRTKLIIEPGSAAIGSAMEFHSSVLDVKDTALSRIVTTDASRTYLDPLWKKTGYTHHTTSKGEPFPRQIICGYTCMDHDRIMVLENSPELAIGDRVVFEKVGNYTVTLGGAFIKPLPAVYTEENEQIELIRRQMTIEQYYCDQSV